MWWLNVSELILLTGALGACCGGFIALVCSNMRMSRCTKIKCCCFECIRDNLSEEEYKEELDNQHQIERSNQAPAPAPVPAGEV